MSILASSHAKGTVLRFLLLLATGAVNLQIASAGCDYLLTVGNRGGVDRFNDETQFLAAGGATTTCTVSSGSNYCDYAYLEIVYGDGVDGSNAYNGNTGSVGSITTGGTITSCDFSISMSDPNDATVLGLELFWRSRGNVQITCSCDRAIPPHRFSYARPVACTTSTTRG
ncbi:expressed unknown protein [Seminavis robusta]|uniref:Uncharacterized protein n=1 Tax=Seminavis robusta TaxID=568900 RepID=A0A9N8DV59_9STRA|nr:expressed unknown protein [Seminavis robusta]|eukprot:Sro316_g115600.1 n/a (170) ;mRNA; f:69879-70388